MLTDKAVARVVYNYRKEHKTIYKYLVVLDSSSNKKQWGYRKDFWSDDESCGTVILSTNNFEKAVASANFWDGRTNVHFVELTKAYWETLQNIDFENSIVNELAESALEFPTSHKFFNAFEALKIADKIDLRARASMRRLGLSL